MSKRKSYFTNFSTDSLFVVLEQNNKELLKLEIKKLTKDTKELRDRIKQLELVVAVARNVIVERYMHDNISITNIANKMLKEKGIKLDVYKEIFTLKILENDEMISLELLEQAIDKLDIGQLTMIIKAKENTIYGDCAIKSYDEMIFDVDEEVYKEYVNKLINDSKERD